MYKSSIFKSIISFFMMLLIAACGSSSSSPTYESQTTATYKFEYIPVTAPVEGKTSYKIRLTNKTTGAAVSGKTVSLNPTMTMTSMTHSTPSGAITDNGDSTYSGTIYYVMASVDATGASMGTWNLEFSVDGEKATFHPVVAMKTGNVVKLKGVDDKIGAMSMTAPPASRTYQIFNDGISGSSANLFITAVDDAMMMKFPAVYSGATLHNSMNAEVPITSIKVELSTDKSTWVEATATGTGHFSGTGLNLSGGHLYVRLTVNGEVKTTDGMATGTAYGDFTLSGM